MWREHRFSFDICHDLQTATLNVALGGFFGACFGVNLAFLLSVLELPFDVAADSEYSGEEDLLG